MTHSLSANINKSVLLDNILKLFLKHLVFHFNSAAKHQLQNDYAVASPWSKNSFKTNNINLTAETALLWARLEKDWSLLNKSYQGLRKVMWEWEEKKMDCGFWWFIVLCSVRVKLHGKITAWRSRSVIINWWLVGQIWSTNLSIRVNDWIPK